MIRNLQQKIYVKNVEIFDIFMAQDLFNLNESIDE